MKKLKLLRILLMGMIVCLLAHNMVLAQRASGKRWKVTNKTRDGKSLHVRVYRAESPGRDGSKKWKFELKPGETKTFSGHGVGSSDPYMLISYWNKKSKPKPRGKVNVKSVHYVFTGRRGAFKYTAQGAVPPKNKERVNLFDNDKRVELFTKKERGIRLAVLEFSSKADEKKVRRAFWIAMDRWHQPHIRKGAAKNTWRHREYVKDKKGKVWDVKLDKPSESYDAVTFALSKYWGLKPGKMSAQVTIIGESLGRSLGRARAGIVNKHHRHYQFKLNKDLVSKRTEAQMAGTIFHEMLHNVGLSHNKGHDYKTDYEGYLVKEWGLSIAGNGKRGFGLVADPYEKWDE